MGQDNMGRYEADALADALETSKQLAAAEQRIANMKTYEAGLRTERDEARAEASDLRASASLEYQRGTHAGDELLLKTQQERDQLAGTGASMKTFTPTADSNRSRRPAAAITVCAACATRPS